MCLSFLVAIFILSFYHSERCVCLLVNESLCNTRLWPRPYIVCVYQSFLCFCFDVCLCVLFSVSSSWFLFPIHVFFLCVHFLFVSCDCRAAIKKHTHLPRYDEPKWNWTHLLVINHRFPVLVDIRGWVMMMIFNSVSTRHVIEPSITHTHTTLSLCAF